MTGLAVPAPGKVLGARRTVIAEAGRIWAASAWFTLPVWPARVSSGTVGAVVDV